MVCQELFCAGMIHPFTRILTWLMITACRWAMHSKPIWPDSGKSKRQEWRVIIPPLDGYKFIFTSVKQNGSKTFTVELPTTSTFPAAGFVALSSAVGPTELQVLPGRGYTTLNVTLRDTQNLIYNVVFRAERQIDSCPWGPMNRSASCETRVRNLFLRITYEPSDNTSLPAGAYNGLLQLRAEEIHDMSFNPLINLPLSIVK